MKRHKGHHGGRYDDPNGVTVKKNAQTYGPGYAPRFKPAGSAEHPSYQTPEGELGHPGDVKGAPKRKGYGNILIDPVTNEWSNTPQ